VTNTRSVAGPGTNVTFGCCASAVPFTVAETVFTSALVERSVAVKSPLAPVVPLLADSVLLVPEAARPTV
jgi:hypothetical protein